MWDGIGKCVWLAKLQSPLSYPHKGKEKVMKFLKKYTKIRQRCKTSIQNSTNALNILMFFERFCYIN